MGPHEGPFSPNHLGYTLHHCHRGGLREPEETQSATRAGGLETLVVIGGWRGCGFTHYFELGQSRENNYPCECHHHIPILLQVAYQGQEKRLWAALAAEVLCLASLIPVILFLLQIWAPHLVLILSHGLKINCHRTLLAPHWCPSLCPSFRPGEELLMVCLSPASSS